MRKMVLSLAVFSVFTMYGYEKNGIVIGGLFSVHDVWTVGCGP